MGSLKEFLDEKAGTIQTRLARATATRDEWLRALEHLIGRVEGRIAEADTDRISARPPS